MIKINKRVLAFLMALVLMFSCTAFASAATPESTAPKLSYETVSEGGSIMPLATEHTIGSQLNQTYGTTNFERHGMMYLVEEIPLHSPYRHKMDKGLWRDFLKKSSYAPRNGCFGGFV